MHTLSLLIYQLFLPLYTLGIHLVSPWNRKAKLWLKGRKRLFDELEAAATAWRGNVIWMHCASLGEFEQGRPLLERMRSEYPASVIVITFFSASGYEVAKNFKGADHVCYLPMDGR